MVVILPKVNIDFWGIDLTEVIWKMVSGIINQQIGTAVHFHGVLHGFQTVHGTKTATLESNLIQKLTKMR